MIRILIVPGCEVFGIIEESTLGYRMNRRTEGSRYEQSAASYLESLGYRILARNYRCRTAEIDLVARQGRYLVFVEVKERSTGFYGYGCESVDLRKQSRICQAARYYMMKERIAPDMPVRFDVVTIDRGRIRLIRNAFFFH